MKSASPRMVTVSIGRLHAGQTQAYTVLNDHRFMALRAGRRFGKTELAKAWIMQGLIEGLTCGWFAPLHMMAAEVQASIAQALSPLVKSNSRSQGVLKTITGGRLDFWSLENPLAGRSRGYHRVVIDEAAFAKNSGEASITGSMLEIWEQSIKPTLYDYEGKALVCSNSAGKNPDNFFYQICTDSRHGFHEYHATTMDNPLLPVRLAQESKLAWLERRNQYKARLREENDPLVYAQEYMARFVDWSGVAFFARDKLLVDGQPVPAVAACDAILAVIDTASKTGTEHDATAVTYFAYSQSTSPSLLILDWDVIQIDGAMLEDWLPTVFCRLEELARSSNARVGSLGAFIEDKNSGTILLQQAKRRGLRVTAIDSKLTAMGKDERAISVSGYVHRGLVKYTTHAFNKTSIYKTRSANHLVDQIEAFQVGDNKSKREDDLLDTFCYGIALSLGDNKGF